MNRATFIKKYRSLTPNQRCRTAITVNNKDDKGNMYYTSYSWNDLFREILKNTETARYLLDVLE